MINLSVTTAAREQVFRRRPMALTQSSGAEPEGQWAKPGDKCLDLAPTQPSMVAHAAEQTSRLRLLEVEFAGRFR
jgi:hypothetical protein